MFRVISEPNIEYKENIRFVNPIAKSLPDPYLNNVVLYLKGDGANNSTTIIDSSPSPKTITRYGDTKISTAQSKYGGSSILFDGNGDYLSLGTTYQSDFNIAGVDATIETWLYITNTNPSYIIGNLDDGSGNGSWWLLLNSTFAGLHQIQFFTRGTSSYRINDGQSFPINQWTHLAISKLGNTATAYINGIAQGSVICSANVGETIPYHVGAAYNSYGGVSYPLNGYIDSLRFTQGGARYTTNFNPETDTYLAY